MYIYIHVCVCVYIYLLSSCASGHDDGADFGPHRRQPAPAQGGDRSGLQGRLPREAGRAHRRRARAHARLRQAEGGLGEPYVYV